MVRNITMYGTLDIAGPEAIFDILFGTDEFTKRYHEKINGDPHAEVSAWNKDDEREVKYVALSEAPRMITKLVGDSFPVKEAQKYLKNGNCYTVLSQPIIDSPNGDRFLTHAETLLSPNEGGGCMVTSNVTLECKGGMWGLAGAVESFMEGKARTGFHQWLAIAKVFCQEKLSMTDTQEMDDICGCSFDPKDDGAPNSKVRVADHFTPINRILNRFRAAFSGCTDTTHGLDPFFMQTVLREVTNIQISCDALKGHLERVNTRVLKMEHEVACVRRLALGRQDVSLSMRTQLAFLGVGVAAGLGLGFLLLRVKRQA